MEQMPLTLYELNELVRETIEISMPDEYWVEAEISEMREVRSHCYMELVQKDMAGKTIALQSGSSAQEAVDGRGAMRIASAILSLL